MWCECGYWDTFSSTSSYLSYLLGFFLLGKGAKDEEKEDLVEEDAKEGMGSYNNKRHDGRCS